jgi:hypothetical protein
MSKNWSVDVEFTRYETQIPIGSMSNCQVRQFSIQVGLKNFTLEEGEKLSVKKKIAFNSYSYAFIY